MAFRVQTGAVCNENIVAAVAIVIEDRDAIPCSFKNIVLAVQTAKDVFHGKPSGLGHVPERRFSLSELGPPPR